ncbi:MAG: GNAT family N-acetyltransferase [Clostridia bacterium]|nr:GNAT family N-acetyltransferase [Clostridia bacterium]
MKHDKTPKKLYKIFSKMPTLSTERLVLRPMSTKDTYDMYEYACREDVTEFLLWSPHPSVAYTRDYLAYIERRYATCDFYDWAVTLADSGKMIGTVGFTKIDLQNNSAEIGYVLNPEYHRKGYGFEATSHILSLGFERLELHRIEARFMQGNTASLRLAEKLGMSLEGYHKDYMLVIGEYKTIGICAILKSEFNINA